jgi:hypothetical protein
MHCMPNISINLIKQFSEELFLNGKLIPFLAAKH